MSRKGDSKVSIKEIGPQLPKKGPYKLRRPWVKWSGGEYKKPKTTTYEFGGKKYEFKKGGRVNTKRENRLEELGRVDAEKAYTRKGKRNLKAEKKRIVREVSSRGAAKRGHGKEIK